MQGVVVDHGGDVAEGLAELAQDVSAILLLLLLLVIIIFMLIIIIIITIIIFILSYCLETSIISLQLLMITNLEEMLVLIKQ